MEAEGIEASSYAVTPTFPALCACAMVGSS